MRTGISRRADFDAEGPRRLARQSKHAAQARRLLALALIYDGGSRLDAARLAKAPKPALAHHVHRTKRMGKWVLISEDPYERSMATTY